MKNHKVYRFESIRETAEAALAGAESYRKDGGDPSSDGYGGWYGVSENLQEAHDLAVKGWQSGGLTIGNAAAQVMPRLREIIEWAPEMVPSHHGMVWDNAALISGDPEPFFDELITEHESQKPIVTVLLGTVYHSGVSPETVTMRGGLCLALMDVLAMLGFQTEVWAETAIEGFKPDDRTERPSMSVLTRVKAAGDPPDITSYAFVTEPGWLRRIVFGIMEGFDEKLRKAFHVGYGYGKPLEVTQSKALGAQITLNFGSGDWPSTYSSDDDKAAWVADLVGKVNGRVVI